MSFKVGDKVKVVRKVERNETGPCAWDEDGHMDNLIGQVGTIVAVYDLYVAVEFPNGYVWNFLPECLELADGKALKQFKKMKFKIKDEEHCKQVQDALRKLGYDWKLSEFKGQYKFLDAKWLHTDDLGREERMIRRAYEGAEYLDEYELCTLEDILDLKETPTVKESNPKDSIGVRKAPLSVVPMNVIAEVGVAMLEGASKYGRHNYRGVGVRSSVYFDATMRHLIDFWEGTDIDPDSGMHHVTKAITSLTVWRDAMLQGKCTDDRPPRSQPFYERLNELAGKIIDKHADKSPKHYTIDAEE